MLTNFESLLHFGPPEHLFCCRICIEWCQRGVPVRITSWEDWVITMDTAFIVFHLLVLCGSNAVQSLGLHFYRHFCSVMHRISFSYLTVQLWPSKRIFWSKLYNGLCWTLEKIHNFNVSFSGKLALQQEYMFDMYSEIIRLQCIEMHEDLPISLYFFYGSSDCIL